MQVKIPKYYQYFAVRIVDRPANPAARTTTTISLVGINERAAPGDIFWGGGPAHCSYAHYAEFTKLKDYGWDYTWPEDFDVDMEFAIDFPPQAVDPETYDHSHTEGMVSPDGLFYPCRYGEHSSLCGKLLRSKRIDPERNQEDHAIRLGYLSMRYAGVVGDDDVRPTKEQLDWLKKVVAARPDYASKVDDFVDLMEHRGFADLVDYYNPHFYDKK